MNLKEALKQKPNYSEAHNNIGRVYVQIKDFDSAIEHLQKAASDLTYASKDKVWVNYGLAYFSQDKFKKSEAYFLKAMGMNRKNCLAYNYYGRALVEQEQFEKAAKTMDQAIYHCKHKGLDEPHYYGAVSLLRLGYKAKALARLEEAQKKFPNGPNRNNIDKMIDMMRLTPSR